MNLNVLGGPLAKCSTNPITGWFRDGCCRTDQNDQGSHTVCARVTTAFLQFSLMRGNDLITPRPEFSFPGLKEGDQWCVCAQRWKEAFEAGAAPFVDLSATDSAALRHISLDALKSHALRALGA